MGVLLERSDSEALGTHMCPYRVDANLTGVWSIALDALQADLKLRFHTVSLCCKRNAIIRL